jgi:hypothetical protein
MRVVVLRGERSLGGALCPAGCAIASLEPNPPVSDANVQHVLQLGIYRVEDGDDLSGVLTLTRTKVLGGQTFVTGHRLAAIHVSHDRSLDDVRRVLQHGDYELVEGEVIDPTRGEIDRATTCEVATAELADGVDSAPPRRRGGRAAAE